jgi:hypothetical protein
MISHYQFLPCEGEEKVLNLIYITYGYYTLNKNSNSSLEPGISTQEVNNITKP